jgi:N-acetylmuramoyl-L-alanine amidase
MSHRARHLHVLASAPFAALLAVCLAPPAHAQTKQPPARPHQYVVAIDAGHGGTPDNNHPAVPFDPGVIGPHGLLEKDVTLDVAQRVQRMLTAQSVSVVMTRSDDRYIDIGTRMQSATDRHASLFVSIHMNSFGSATAGGTTVLYPADASSAFAQRMSDTLGTELAPLGLADDGTQLKSDMWVTATMPTVTVEAAYLSNPYEEALMGEADARDAIARAIVVGIGRQSPGMVAPPPPVAVSTATRSLAGARATGAVVVEASGHAARNLMLFALAMVVWWRRRSVFPVAARLAHLLVRGGHAAIHRLLGDAARIDSRRSARARRHQKLHRGRRQALLLRSQQLAPHRQVAGARTSYHSVYDDFRF